MLPPLPAPPLVVLIHGLHSNEEELVFIQAGLQRAGIDCHLPRIQGYTFDAKTEMRPTAPDWQSWVRQLVDEVRQLGARHGPVVVSGISAGANLAIAVALQAPEAVAGVVPLSTSLFVDGWKIPFYSPLALLAYYTPLGALWTYKESSPYGVKDERIRQWIERELARKGTSAAGSSTIPNDYLRENHRLQRWLRHRLKEDTPRVPMLAIHAQHDEIASLRNTRYLAKNWQKNHFQQLILMDSYHMVSIDRERGKVTLALARFVNELGPPPHTSPDHSCHKPLKH